MEAGAMSICGKEDLHRPCTLLGKKGGLTDDNCCHLLGHLDFRIFHIIFISQQGAFRNIKTISRDAILISRLLMPLSLLSAQLIHRYRLNSMNPNGHFTGEGFSGISRIC